MDINELEPRGVWRRFLDLTRIPRASGSESAAAEYVREALRRLAPETDGAGNVFARVPATPGRTRAPSLCLQAHLDMVAVKDPESPHDFTRDPLDVAVDDGWVHGRGTTLGADNGIGVALILALADDAGLVHGPLELLFTVREEIGLLGMVAFDAGRLQSRLFVNLDSETEGQACIGCAGGIDTDGTFALAREHAAGEGRGVRVRGLRGGHSGMDIGRGRANALKLLARVLDGAGVPFRLVSLRGGDKRNAIPAAAEAEVLVEPGRAGTFDEGVARLAADIRREFAEADPGIAIAAEPSSVAGPALDQKSTRSTLELLASTPHGVLARPAGRPDLVSTSTNLAAAIMEGDSVTIRTSQRSDRPETLAEIADGMAGLFRAAGGEISRGAGYPPWPPNPNSPLLARANAVHHGLYGADLTATVLHAGLECAVLRANIPDMDLLSLGPTVENAHSPAERLSIGSVARFWPFLRALVADIGGASC